MPKPSENYGKGEMIATALLVIDMQRDFLETSGRLALPAVIAKRTLEGVNAAVAHSVVAGEEVVYIVNAFRDGDWTNIFRKWAAIAGTPGAELDPRLTVASAYMFTKDRGDAFSNRALLDFLHERAIQMVTITGVYADHCVQATVRGALCNGFSVTVLADAIGSSSDVRVTKAIARFRQLGARVN
ncbi:MAG: cysteine hydrolase family protein [Vulcanimicrobiaceae bacterium]